MTSNLPDAPRPAEALGNLPAEPNAFIGRERDLADLVSMLGRVRAVTLCGPGGIGKTRLALKLAASLVGVYPDGAWLADLAEADAPERLVPLVTGALGIRAEPDRPLADTLIEALRSRTMLLVLDTCEHLVQGCAGLVQRLLDSCPGVRVLATSREALRVRGEVIWRVPALGMPEPVSGEDAVAVTEAILDCESVRLFVARASAVWPGFRLRADNAATVADLCRAVAGVPLAIELAAARVRTLSAEQIRQRLATKFELLALGDRTAPARQQTLRATIEWSYDLLTSAERTLLRRLSVFQGWSMEAAEQVCADSQLPAAQILDVLTTLIDKSLVIVDPELRGVGRYRLLDGVREIAAEQAAAAGETPRLRAAHRDRMLAMAVDVAERAFVRGDPPWPERVSMYHRVLAERPNFHLALAYCAESGEAEAGLRICHALGGSWLASGDVNEGAAWIDRLLAVHGPVADGVRARALAVRAELAFEQQDYARAAEFAAICLRLSRASGDGNPATALRLQALSLLMTGRATQALRYADEALAAARQMRDDWEVGVALASRAGVLTARGELAQAKAGYVDALDALAGNNRWGVANVLYGLGQLARARGDGADAASYFGDAIAIFAEIDARPEIARCLGGIGMVALAQGDLDAARSSLAQSVRLSLGTGQRLGCARGLAALAAVSAAEHDTERAVTVAAAALSLCEVVGAATASAVRRIEELVAAAKTQLSPAQVTSLIGEGRALSPHQALSLVTSAAASTTTTTAADRPARHATRSEPADRVKPDRTPVWPGPLSDREQEVAMLVARGLSNRAIGEKLFITQATAARHVANIFVKLGFSSRSQVASWVLRSQDVR